VRWLQQVEASVLMVENCLGVFANYFNKLKQQVMLGELCANK
jgi:hypothetical protein